MSATDACFLCKKPLGSSAKCIMCEAKRSQDFAALAKAGGAVATGPQRPIYVKETRPS